MSLPPVLRYFHNPEQAEIPRRRAMVRATRCGLRTVSTPTRDRKFESHSLHRRLLCEPVVVSSAASIRETGAFATGSPIAQPPGVLHRVLPEAKPAMPNFPFTYARA